MRTRPRLGRRSVRARRTKSAATSWRRRSSSYSLLEAVDRGERSGPEHLSDHRGVHCHRLSPAVPACRAARRSPPPTIPERTPARSPACARAPGRTADCRLRVRRVLLRALPIKHRASHLARLHRAQWRQRDRGRVSLTPAPPRLGVEQLEPRRTEHDHRHALRSLHQLDRRTRAARVAPVQIFDQQHQRLGQANPFEEPAPRGKRLLAVGARGPGDDRRVARGSPAPIAVLRLGEDHGDSSAEASEPRLGVV